MLFLLSLCFSPNNYFCAVDDDEDAIDGSSDLDEKEEQKAKSTKEEQKKEGLPVEAPGRPVGETEVMVSFFPSLLAS